MTKYIYSIFVVTPDNGALTLVAEYFGIDEVRQIDEATNRRKDSGYSCSYPFCQFVFVLL